MCVASIPQYFLLSFVKIRKGKLISIELMLFFYWADNELCGNGVGISVSPYQYANDITI